MYDFSQCAYIAHAEHVLNNYYDLAYELIERTVHVFPHNYSITEFTICHCSYSVSYNMHRYHIYIYILMLCHEIQIQPQL